MLMIRAPLRAMLSCRHDATLMLMLDTADAAAAAFSMLMRLLSPLHFRQRYMAL